MSTRITATQVIDGATIEIASATVESFDTAEFFLALRDMKKPRAKRSDAGKPRTAKGEQPQ